MRHIVQTIFGAVIGLIISFCVLILFDSLNARLYPATHMSPTMEDAMKDVQNLPLTAKWLVVLGFCLSSFFGGYMAARIAPASGKMVAAFSVGFLLLLGGIIYFVAYSLPLWMAVVSCTSYLLFSFFGGKAATYKRGY